MLVLHLSNVNTFKDGGIYFYIKNLQKYQNKLGINSVWISCKSKNKVNRTSDLINRIKKLAPDIIHIHGIWTIQTRLINDLIKITKNIIVAPHGMLNQTALNKSKIKKKLAFLIYEKRNLEMISFFHALTEKEVKEIKKMFPHKSSKIISTGISMPNKKTSYFRFKWLKKIKKSEKIILYLGRLENQKGIKELLKAWQEINKEKENKCWWLLIVGYGNLTNFVKNKSNDIDNKIIFNGSAFGAIKDSILELSDAFILPSKGEALPISVLEALSYKKVCLLSKECGFKNLNAINSSFEFNVHYEDIKETLLMLFKLSNLELDRRGELGLNYVKNNHNWEKVALQSRKHYNSLISHEN